MRLRKDGSLGPLFINRKQRVPVGPWLAAEAHPTKGFALRPGWHATGAPVAPHLSPRGRVWCQVDLKGVTKLQRPHSQGSEWFLATHMRVRKVLKETARASN